MHYYVVLEYLCVCNSHDQLLRMQQKHSNPIIKSNTTPSIVKWDSSLQSIISVTPPPDARSDPPGRFPCVFWVQKTLPHIFLGKNGLFVRTVRVGPLFTVWRQGQRRQPKTVIRVGCAVSGPQASLRRSRPMIHNFKGIFEHFRAILIVKRFSGK